MNIHRSITIVQKIWFILSLLALGYFFSTLLGFYLRMNIEAGLENVSEKRLPMTQKSGAALAAFKEQIRLYADAIMVGNPSEIHAAAERAAEVDHLLSEISQLQPADNPRRQAILNSIDQLSEFSKKSKKIYTRLSSDFFKASADADVINGARALASETGILQKSLTSFYTHFSEDLQKDLVDINKNSRNQRYVSLLVFFGVFFCCLILTAIIISRTIALPLEKSLLLEKVMQQFADGIAVTDANGKIIFVNWAWAHMHGFKANELNGRPMELFHTTEQIQGELTPFNAVVAQEGVNSAEVWHKRKDGTIFPTHMTTSQMLDEKGRPYCKVSSVREITKQKLREEQLRKAKTQAEAASIAKTDFLTNVSYEIRTPLNSVMGVLNLLLTTDLDEEQLDLVKTGKSSADGLLGVISDVLDFSRIESGRLDLEIFDFNLGDMMEELADLITTQAHSKGLEFAYMIAPDIPNRLRGDSNRLRQIISNLTDNAVKFTKEGDIYFQAHIEEETETDVKLHFEVRDTGIGIHEADTARIFKPFEQCDASSTRIYSGTGLGLNISRKLAELMQGQIGVKSELGQGSTFWFTARFEKQTSAEASDATIPPDISAKRFLLVDDNQTNIDILGSHLASWGCMYDVAFSGEVALSLLNAVAKVNAPFDAVMVNALIPGLDGEELVRKIKSTPLLSATRVVMLIPMGLRGENLRMKAIGYDACLTKPIRPSQLFNCILTIFSQKPGRDQERTELGRIPHTTIERPLKKISVLVVEDNEVNQKLVVKMIEKVGFDVDLAFNGQEAVRKLETSRFDLVLMNIQMPLMDGYEATRLIRDPNSNVLNHAIPIVALTANTVSGDRERCLAAGMNDYITKPVQAEELLAVIVKNVLHENSDITPESPSP